MAKPAKTKIDFKEWWHKKRIVLTYGTTNFGTHWFNTFFAGLRTVFFIEVMGMTNIIAGVLDLVTKFAKPWVTFLTGVLVEARPFKKGKYFPWLQVGSVGFIGSAVLMFAAPLFFEAGTAGATFVAVLFAINVIFASILGTVRVIVYANVSSNNTERTVAGSVSSLMMNVAKQGGGIFYPLLFGLMVTQFCDRNAYLPTSILMGAVTLIIYFFIVGEVKRFLNDDEIVEVKGGGKPKKEKFSLVETGKLLIKNRALLAMVVCFVLYNARNMGMGVLTVIIYKNVLGDMKLLAVSRSIGFILTWVITPLIPLIVVKFSMKNAFLIFMGFFTICGFLYTFPGIGLNPSLFIIVQVAARTAVVVLQTLFLAMFAQAIDYGEWKTGKRQAGIQMTFFTLSTNWAMILAVVLRTTLLEIIGYKAGMVFDMGVKLAFIKFYGLSSVLYLIGWLVVLFFYPINGKMQKQIEEDLEAKKAAEAVPATE